MMSLAKFAELSEYKNTIIDRLLQSEELTKALKYSENDFLAQPSVDDPSQLIYKNIFPYRFIPEANILKETFITISFRKYRLVNSRFKSGYIYLNVFTHRDLFQTVYGCTRVDYLLTKIDELLNQQRGIGMGKLEFNKMDELTVNDLYQGTYIRFKSTDFN